MLIFRHTVTGFLTVWRASRNHHVTFWPLNHIVTKSFLCRHYWNRSDDISPNGAKWDWGICPKPFWHVGVVGCCAWNPLVIIFITWLMIIKVVFWAKRLPKISTLTINRHAIFFFTMGFMPPTHTTGVNFRFIAFAFQPRRAKYDLGIMRADRVRYGQVVIFLAVQLLR